MAQLSGGKISKPRRTLSNQAIKFVCEGKNENEPSSHNTGKRMSFFHHSPPQVEISGRRYSAPAVSVSENSHQQPSNQSSLKRLSSRRRASSLLGSNLSVDPCSYYRHISSDLPGPLRMRQLLIWCLQTPASFNNAKKEPFDKDSLIADLSGSEAPIQLQEDLIIKSVLEGVVDGLIKKHVQTTWYHVPIEKEVATWENYVSLLSASAASAIAGTTVVGRASLAPECDLPADIIQSELDSKRILLEFSSFLKSFSFKICSHIHEKALRFADDAYHELYTKVVKPLEPNSIGDSIGVLRALSRTVPS
ncbi:kinetochore protein Mis13 [Mitosporidium daphniae]|uniref:Kinetochore protein Mis13 n=1 Tax=Mitosporidium daphniae TaxID=1485682 RepID=A0A098VWI5_9MICR|nr:kinetochore protein Mis13 [Mitosporidium daphniae]KGG53244.1 kinetochore protein Mis13 [Mitosporidium daphniae]|eukprot:XP_013239680.1 kinetochore protein Mis13 [Mitosporidium daphniae]